jgi:5-formyltetrahydrofolate cyclo-ligase
VNAARLKREKRRVRRRVLALRDAVPPERRASAGEAIADRFLALPEVERARCVMLFWSFGSEVPTAGIVGRLQARDVLVALPRIEGLDVVPVAYAPGDPTRATPFGAMEPTAGEVIDPRRLEVVAVPGVAFDRRGRRIGYGGGFYDRFLRTTPALPVGLAFALQVLDEDLPAGHVDLPVAAIVTEAETIRAPDLNSRSTS